MAGLTFRLDETTAEALRRLVATGNRPVTSIRLFAA
jgi:hypothetical protein